MWTPDRHTHSVATKSEAHNCLERLQHDKATAIKTWFVMAGVKELESPDLSTFRMLVSPSLIVHPHKYFCS